MHFFFFFFFLVSFQCLHIVLNLSWLETSCRMFMSNKTDVSAFCSLSLVLLDRTKKLERKRLRRSWTKRKTMAQPKEFVTGERRGQMMPTVMCTMYYNQTTGRRETCQLSAPTINDRSPNASILTKCLCLKQ